VQQTALASWVALITSAISLAACGGSNGPVIDGPAAPAGAAANTPGGDPSNGSPNAGGVANGGGVSNAGSTSSGSGTPEGNPALSGGLDGSAQGNVPPASDGSTAGPAAGGATEPTDCVLTPALTTPVGYGAATTGGGDAPAVIVNDFAEAEAALAAYRSAFKDGEQTALVLRYTGSFDFATITDVCAQHLLDAQTLELKEMENVTFEGAPGSSANFGIHINRARNVIVRNMTMGLLPGGGDSDAITIEGNGTNGDVENVWIDHNELFSSTKDDCDGAGDTEFDGLIDIKKGARRITISYNFLHDHQKTGLIGFSDDDDTERYVTFHHNRYENVVSRTPLHRFGFVHLFNNYYGNILSSGINVRMGGVALIESNFFENAANPVTSRFSDEPGFWELRDNHVGAGITWTTEEDTLANAETWESTATFPPNELGYAYTPDDAACVKQIVLASAGATL
jgi:pectate lyase